MEFAGSEDNSNWKKEEAFWEKSHGRIFSTDKDLKFLLDSLATRINTVPPYRIRVVHDEPFNNYLQESLVQNYVLREPVTKVVSKQPEREFSGAKVEVDASIEGKVYADPKEKLSWLRARYQNKALSIF